MRTLVTGSLRLALLATALLLAAPAAAFAQADGPRTYWKGLSYSHAVNLWMIHASGNTNPYDASSLVVPNTDFQANLALAGYHLTFPLASRSAMASLVIPGGNLESDTSTPLVSSHDAASGWGDPMLQLVVNIFGAPAMRDLPSVLRYEPTFTIDVLTTLAIPIGEYDDDEALNLGQNRWYGRVGLPMMWTLAPFLPWIPGERTTLEVLPVVWLYGDNTDFGGRTLSTDPMLQLEGHFTRDFTESLWGSVDAAWYYGGRAEVGSTKGEKINNVGVGLTFGFNITDNLQITASYFSTIDDDGKDDLRGDEFRLCFTFAWHKLIEGKKRLEKE